MVGIRNSRVWSYFSNLVVQQLEISFTVLARWWIIPKSAALLIVSERAEIWGNLCICSNCKTCTFYLYCFLHILLSRELWIHWKCTIFFYLADELLSPTRFQLYIIFHLGPKTADRISIFTLTWFWFCLLVCCTVIQMVNLLFIFMWWNYWEYSLVKSIFPNSRTVRSFN